MAFLKNKILSKFVLSLLLFWAGAYFYLLNQYLYINIIVAFFVLIVLILIWFEIGFLFSIIFLSFLSTFVLYGYLFAYNLPLWLVMIGFFLVHSYLFFYLEQKSEIVANLKMIYLFLFSLLVLELFLFLSYFLISPLNRSFLIAALVYFISGFTSVIIAKKESSGIIPFVLIFSLLFVMILLSANWGAI